MALYAFDGTWNIDDIDDGKDTNVVKFVELYTGKKEYEAGVGTRLGALGRAAGGLFGLGGRTRINEMCEALAKNWENGDRIVDIIGFSRGAALAVHFANKIGEEGIELSNGEKINPKVRFLGVWDIVGSFGLSFDTIINFQEINLGWDIDYIANNVEKCCHAMALDERRETFNITRLDPNNALDNVEERWFRGVHSDIGGGNENPDRSNIALQWMLKKALSCNLPIDVEKAKLSKYAKINVSAKISENIDVQIDPRRVVYDADIIDPSAKPKQLNIGETHECTVLAKLKFNWSGVFLEKGAKYKFSVTPGDTWSDADIECGPGGWTSDRLPWAKDKIVSLFESRRRYPKANWFELVGAYGDEDDDLFRLGNAEQGQVIQATTDGDLYLFANDLNSKYDNNDGELKLTIERIS